MAASKRDFANFKEFPGEVNEGTGMYEFPPLYHEDDLKHLRVWRIFVRLVKDSNRQDKINFNLLDEKQVEITNGYFEKESLPKGVIAEAFSESGVDSGKITRTIPTYFDSILNEGKANERNPFQTALIYARNLYLKKESRGGTENTSGKKKTTISNMFFPMLAKKWDKGQKHLVYPLYIQPKLDGVRCISYLKILPAKVSEATYEDVIIYSRSQKEFPKVDYLKKILLPYMKMLYDKDKKQSIYLDGEIYKHGKKQQDISGEIRSSEGSMDNEYHIYDIFYPKDLNTIYESRKEQLDEIFKGIKKRKDTDAEKYLKEVLTVKVDDYESAVKYFNKWVKEGYEGAIFRNTEGVYLASATRTGENLRSNDLVKMKKKSTEEFNLVGFTQGKKGKDVGAIIYICETAKGKKFNVTPKDMTYEERYKLYDDFKKNFDKKYNGLKLTVEYQDLSKDSVPQMAKGISIRDYE